MGQVGGWKILPQGLVAVVLLPILGACGGAAASAGSSTVAAAGASQSGSSSQTATGGTVSSNTGTASSASSNTTTGSSASSGTIVLASANTATVSSVSSTTTTTTTLFEQPLESGITGHLAVPLATNTSAPKGAFALVLWQPDRFTSNGLLVPTGWNAGSKTGFTPANPLAAQLGFQNKVGTSTAQMEDDTVGAYINSADLPPLTTDQKMMITPEYTWLVGNQPMPFASLNSSLRGSLDLQVPTAVGRSVYVVEDLLFKDANGVKISFGVKLFANGATNPVLSTGYDAPSNSYMLNSPLGWDQRFVTKASTSGSETGTPWLGWHHFQWSVSEAQFASALQYLAATYPGKVTSTDPAQWVLAGVHLNAEFHTKGLPAALGWSMRGMKLWTN